jgi:hypothetical protein
MNTFLRALPNVQTYQNFIFILFHDTWHTRKLLDGLNYKSKVEDSERKKSWGTLPGL